MRNLEEVTWPIAVTIVVSVVAFCLVRCGEDIRTHDIQRARSHDAVVATCIKAGRTWDGERCE